MPTSFEKASMDRHCQDRRDLPSYTLTDAAHYLRLPVATLRQWGYGRETDGRRYGPVLVVERVRGRGRVVLSFNNLVECHILAAIRQALGVTLQNIRRALRYVQKKLGARRPLLHKTFETDGKDLFVGHLGRCVNVSKEGQLAAREILRMSLLRIERDEKGWPIRLYPFVGVARSDAPRIVVVNPAIAFGRPVLVGTGIPTEEIASRARAGEPFREIAKDFGINLEDVTSALLCETRVGGHARAA